MLFTVFNISSKSIILTKKMSGMLNLDFASLIKESCLTLNTMSMQLSFFLIDQKCNVCIDGRKFLIRTLLKDLGLKRLAPICYITLICSTLFIWA